MTTQRVPEAKYIHSTEDYEYDIYIYLCGKKQLSA